MDKNKIIEGAAKLVAKGAYDKAIKEYQKVLETDPKDVRVLQKMGELFQKKNDNDQAAHYFTKVAESYSSDGFFLKAVALYKQVLKLNPNLMDVNLKLAELHQQLGLMSEAMAYYQVVANHYDKAGDTKASLDTLKKMVDLDPDNVASRIKLAELYAREHMSAEATQEFKRAAEYLKRNSRTDDYLRVAERIATLEPDNHALSKELATAFLQKGDQKRALARLQVCFKANSQDIETLNLLAQAFHGLGQTSKTISVYKELAKIYATSGQQAEESRIWERVRALDPRDPDLEAREGPPPAREEPPAPREPPRRPTTQAGQVQSPPRTPQPARQAPQTPPPAASAPPAAAQGAAQLSKLLTETDVYVKYGLHDKALEHLRKIFAVDPENLDAHEKAYQIYVAANNQAQAFEQLLNVLRLCTRRADVQRAQPYLQTILQQNPGHPEVPAFVSVLRGDGAAPAMVMEAEQAPQDEILVSSNDEEVIIAEAPADALAAGSGDVALDSAMAIVGEGDEVISEDHVDVGAAIDGQETTEEPALAFAQEAADEPLEPLTSPGGVPVALAGTEYSDEDQESKTVLGLERAAEPELEEEPRTQISTSPIDVEAAVTVPEYRRVPKAVPQTTVVTEFAGPPTGKYAKPPPRAESKTTVGPTPSRKAPPPKQPEPEAEDAVSAELDEATFMLDQGLVDEAREILETVLIAAPSNARAKEMMERLEALEADSAETGPHGALPEEPGAEPPDGAQEGEGKDAFDLAAELAGELGELGAASEDASALPAGDDFQYSVEEVFSEFKKNLEKVVKPEDVDTHYDLGIAYKEMGLVDDAIGEFNVAREGCEGKKKELDCLTMLGLLYSGKGEHSKAVEVFKEALTSEHAAGEPTKALSFELGTTYEAMGKPGKALYHFKKVAQAEPAYRDVSSIVARLEAEVSPESDPLPPRSSKPRGPGSNGSNGSNGTNGVKPSGPKPGGGGGSVPQGAKPGEAGKARKVGYV